MLARVPLYVPMSISLTLSQPTRTEYGGRFTQCFSPKSRLSPKPRIDYSVSSLQVGAATESKMSTSHRGLPPPSAMTLPDPGRPPPSLSQPLGAMPAPPNQWHGQEESMRNWLVAKAEEDKRKQEEERTRQESFKLEQRRIEQSMLRESLSAGVPPSMVPMIYAGIGGSNLANVSLDWLQQYAAQLQAAQHQIQQQSSPELRRETRLIGQVSSPYAVPQTQSQQVVPSQSTEHSQQTAPLQTTFSAYQTTPGRAPATAVPRSATHTQLPRLTTNEMYVQQPAQQGPGSAHPLQQSQTVQHDQPASSPSIYFHHWVPPGESKSTQPQTPASRAEPSSAHPGSHISESEYKESPRKRKAQGEHPKPPPTSGPQWTSPSFSAASYGSARRGGRARSRSNASGRDTDSRPESRRDPDPPRSQPESGQSSDERRLKEMSLQQGEPTRRPSSEAQREYRAERPDSREPR